MTATRGCAVVSASLPARRSWCSTEAASRALVTGFAATADPTVSFDGTKVLFAGKREAKDAWQVWEVGVTGRRGETDHYLRRRLRATVLSSGRTVGVCAEDAGALRFAERGLRVGKEVADFATHPAMRCRRMCCVMDGFCSRRRIRWAAERLRRSTRCIRTAAGWSRIAAITDRGERRASRLRRATSCSRASMGWDGLPRPWRIRWR